MKGGNGSRRAHLLEEADKKVRRKKKGEWVERCATTARRGAVVLPVSVSGNFFLPRVKRACCLVVVFASTD